MRVPIDRASRTLFGVVGLCAFSLFFGGCIVTVLSGPVEVEPGDFATFELRLTEGFGGGANDVTLILVAEVPEGWDLVTSEFVGTANGSPISGSGMVSAGAYCEEDLGPDRDGMKRISIIAGPFASTNESDEGTATLQFHAAQQPAGEFKIGFVFGGGDASPGDEICGSRRFHTINRDGRLISFVQALFDEQDVPTLEQVHSVAVTPDGQHVVAMAIAENAVNLFSRDAVSGELTFVKSLIDGSEGVDGLGQPLAFQISPEGRHVFVASAGDEAIATLELTEGDLSFAGAVFDGIGGVTGLSGLEDLELFGSWLYVGTNDGVTVFERDPVSGELTFLQEFTHPDLFGVPEMVMSPDGKHLYASDYTSTLSILEIGPETGLVSLADQVMSAPHEMAISPDGRHFYSIREDTRQIRIFERDVTSGQLTHLMNVPFSEFGSFISYPSALQVSPLGDTVVVADTGSISILARHPTDGSLSLYDFEIVGDGPAEGFADVRSIAHSADGVHLYTASWRSFANSSVAAFVAGPAYVFTDGFESGGTTAWSATIP